MSCAVIRKLLAGLAHAALEDVHDVQLLADRTQIFVASLNWNDEVRPITRSSGRFASRFSNSSDRPSAKYSWSLPALMSANGSTAIDFSFGAAAAVVDSVFVADFAAGARHSCLRCTRQLHRPEPVAVQRGVVRFSKHVEHCVTMENWISGAWLNCCRAFAVVTGAGSKPSSCRTLWANAGGVSPPGSRVHCTSRNSSGTRASASWVSSITTGTRKAASSAMSRSRRVASFHWTPEIPFGPRIGMR